MCRDSALKAQLSEFGLPSRPSEEIKKRTADIIAKAGKVLNSFDQINRDNVKGHPVRLTHNI